MLTSRFRKYAGTCSWFACAAATVLSYSAAASDTLIRSRACLACHQIDRKVVGPSFQDIAARHGHKPDARDVLTRSIRDGSTGAWGPVPMPPNARISVEEANKLAEWVLTQKP